MILKKENETKPIIYLHRSSDVPNKFSKGERPAKKEKLTFAFCAAPLQLWRSNFLSEWKAEVSAEWRIVLHPLTRCRAGRRWRRRARDPNCWFILEYWPKVLKAEKKITGIWLLWGWNWVCTNFRSLFAEVGILARKNASRFKGFKEIINYFQLLRHFWWVRVILDAGCVIINPLYFILFLSNDPLPIFLVSSYFPQSVMIWRAMPSADVGPMFFMKSKVKAILKLMVSLLTRFMKM